MIKTYVIVLFCMLVAYSGKAQSPYLKKNLIQSSQEELNLHLTKAKKLRKKGAILSIAGPASAVIGLAMFANNFSLSFGGASESNDDLAAAGLGLFLVGTGTTLVGIPILGVNSLRVKRIKGVINSNSRGVYLELVPGVFQNQVAQKKQTGLSLRLRF